MPKASGIVDRLGGRTAEAPQHGACGLARVIAAMLSDALASALRVRGVPDLQAALAARAGVAGFARATLSWLAQEEPGLGERLDRAEAAFKALL